MGQRSAGAARNHCTHGGIYSVDHRRVRLDFSSSVNPLGTPARAIAAITRGARQLAAKYPDPECSDLRKMLADYTGAVPENIVVGNGAVEIIYWFARAFAGSRVVVPAPTFCEYELAAGRAGAKVDFVQLGQYELEADSVIRAARGADAVFLCNPNNPTGLLSSCEVERILERVGKETMILLDECFIELTDEATKNSLVHRIGEFDNLVILRSLTKSFALAGLRVGYAVSSSRVAGMMREQRIPWNVNGLAQAAGVAALSSKDYLRRAVKLVSAQRKFLFQSLSKMNTFAPHRSDANFFMLDLGDRNSTKFRDKLLADTGILVRDCSTFTGMDSHHVRIAVRNRRENIALIGALEALDNG